MSGFGETMNAFDIASHQARFDESGQRLRFLRVACLDPPGSAEKRMPSCPDVRAVIDALQLGGSGLR